MNMPPKYDIEQEISMVSDYKVISFREYINSNLPEKYDGRKCIISDLRSDSRAIPEIDSEDDLITFVSSHPEVSIPPYGTLYGLYEEWRAYQHYARKKAMQ